MLLLAPLFTTYSDNPSRDSMRTLVRTRCSGTGDVVSSTITGTNGSRVTGTVDNVVRKVVPALRGMRGMDYSAARNSGACLYATSIARAVNNGDHASDNAFGIGSIGNA